MKPWSAKHWGWVSWVLIGLTLFLTAGNIVWTWRSRERLAAELEVQKSALVKQNEIFGKQLSDNQVMLDRYLNGAYLWRSSISAKQDTILNLLRRHK